MVKVPATNLTSHAATTNAVRDIHPPVEIPTGWAWLGWSLGILALLVILVLAWRYWQRRRNAVPQAPPVPPHIRARQKLREALRFLVDAREFCTRVSDTIRAYLEERFDFRAPERTTEEFLYELQATELLTPSQKASLADFLQQCDLVKFARYEPSEPELNELHSSALRLVDETAPTAPLPTTPEQRPPEISSSVSL